MQRKFDFTDFTDWERGALKELYQEYRSVILGKKLFMRPAALEFSDSKTHWGHWDPLTRTISLSRQLILNHPWFQVVGILRHEMAHQWVDEASGQDSSGLPHGKRFQLGCRIIGVPQEFSSASAHLQSSALDWREDKRDEIAEKLLDKVRKLLALATSSNEHEALLAMNKVRELYAKYNLEQAAEDIQSRFAHCVISHGKKRMEAHQKKIAGILVGHFFVQVLGVSHYDPRTGDRLRGFELIGTRENVLMAEYVYYFLLQQTDFWVREAAKTGENPISRVERKSYRLGILEGFAEKLERTETEKATPPAEAQKTPSTELNVIGKAVVKLREDPRLVDYLSEIYPRITSGGTSWQRLDHSSFDAGREVGKTLTLHKAVSDNQGNRGRLLS